MGLSHARLCIVDLNTGQQPMQGSNRNVVSYNGEIYNYIQLRRELGESSFVTSSDNEVDFKAYERWGFDCKYYF